MQPLFASGARGRGRGRRLTNNNLSENHIKFSPSLELTHNHSTSSSPSRTDTFSDELESGFSSESNSIDYSTSSKLNLGHGHGSRHFRDHMRSFEGNSAPIDPYWMVTNLTYEEFHSHQRPKKPDQLGTLGKQIQVIANFFPILRFPYRGLVYKYQIQIRNKKQLEIHRDRRRILYNSWLQGLCRRDTTIDRHKIVFDNQSRILTYDQPLPDEYEVGKSEQIMGPSRNNRQEPHTVTIQRVGAPVDLALINNLDALFDRNNPTNERLENLQDIKQSLSIALHEHCSSHAAFVCTRSFYSPSVDGRHGEWDLGNGKAMWRGFYSCLMFGKGRHQLLMNIDVSHTVFLKKQPFLEFLCEIMLHSPSGKRDYGGARNTTKVDGNDALSYLDSRSSTYEADAAYLLKNCKSMRVRSQDANKPIIYEIVKLALPASRQKFVWKFKRDQTFTVADYYKEHYNLDLKYPSLPVLEMRNGACVPMELVDVEPARVKRITDEQRAMLCRYSSMKPQDYGRAINNIRANREQQRFEEDPFVAAWNLNVDVKMITVPARVLPMPVIRYTNEYQVRENSVRDLGTWEVPRSAQFYKPSSFPKVWGIINFSSLSESVCVEFFHELKHLADQRGMICSEPSLYEEMNAQRHSTQELMEKLKYILHANNDCQFLLVILPSAGSTRSDIYTHLKKLCELECDGLGIITQMIRQKNSVSGNRRDRTKWDYATLGTMLLKLNSKLSGINSVLKVPDIIERFFSRGHRIMYVGADLSHRSSTVYSSFSIAAVVASADDIPNRYFKEVYKQMRPPHVTGQSREFIVSMRDIMKSLIQQYNQHRGYPPTTIVIYRDGISEGEFDTVFEKELTAVREACVDLSPSYRPYLTYIVVSKRHHTRFFPTNSDRNVPAGTVIDSHDITNPVTYDFYLNSHHGALGTSRPTHYYVLYDDNNLKPDEVQMLTYALCYTYARCTKSVSIPAPVKYADLLALRAAYYLDDTDGGSDTMSMASGSSFMGSDGSIEVEMERRSERIRLSSKLDGDCLFFV